MKLINFYRTILLITAIVLFTSSILAAPQGTFAGNLASTDHVLDYHPISNASVVTQTLPQRLFLSGDTPGTCDTPRPAPTQNNPTGTFRSRAIRITSTFTGCMTVRIRGTGNSNYSGAAYTNFNQNNVKENLLAYAGWRVAERGEYLFFSFRVQQGSRYEIVVWNTEPGNDNGTFIMDLSSSLAGSSDFDGDGQTDSAVFRPSNGAWYILQSSNNTVAVDFFGSNGDVPLDGDFDGDGKTDLGIFRPSNGTWYYKRSSNGSFFGAFFGLGTDKPIPGDYDRDGITDIGAFRDGQWLISPSSGGAIPHTTVTGYPFGSAGDIPVGSQRK